MTLKTYEWDGSEHIETADDFAVFISDAIEQNHPGLLRRSLGTIARAIGMTEIARIAGVPRTDLYAALLAAEDGDPTPLAHISTRVREQLESVSQAA